MRSVAATLRAWELRTRPVDAETRAAMERRWADLPDSAKTRDQVLGRVAVGCEGTHGVFPRCNLACTPCYHSRDANQVRVDGAHTITRIREQMQMLRARRGPRAHAQLIGGEVSLLAPDDHAEALSIMRANGREPMSFTHGDLDYDYLRDLAVGPDGRRRFDRLSFAGHFDMLMFGRRGLERPPDEASLNPYRRQFVEHFRRLRREPGVATYIAHNMTVTPRNLDQVSDVIRANRGIGFDLFSFQPAAFIGDERRWHDDYAKSTSDAVWAEVEKGAGARLPYKYWQVGDHRCNRASYGFYVGDDWFPLLDDEDAGDMRVRDVYFTALAGLNFADRSAGVLIAKLLRVAVGNPRAMIEIARWAARKLRTVGFRRLLRHRSIRVVAFTQHSFMDAADVAPAWEAMQRGETCTDPRLRETQERLGACFYAMAHPETGELVPACVQHSVLDPGENAALRSLLPLTPKRTAGQRD